MLSEEVGDVITPEVDSIVLILVVMEDALWATVATESTNVSDES